MRPDAKLDLVAGSSGGGATGPGRATLRRPQPISEFSKRAGAPPLMGVAFHAHPGLRKPLDRGGRNLNSTRKRVGVAGAAAASR